MALVRSAEEVIAEAQRQRRAGTPAPIDVRGADLSGLMLASGDLVGANFEGADLTGAFLAGAALAGANLKNAILVGASLDGADLTDADLRGADLAGARLDDAVLAGTRLEGACLQAVFGEPLSVTAARIDQITIELSQFTRRDISRFLARGVDLVDGPAESRASELAAPLVGHPSVLPVIHLSPTHAPDSDGPVSSKRVVDPRDCAADEPESSKRVFNPFDFDMPLLHASEVKAVLNSLHPSALLPIKELARPSSLPSKSLPSILPAIRSEEISIRLEQVRADQEEMPLSQRMFLQLNALIEEARGDAVATHSLRPQKASVKMMAESAFSFPRSGEVYLGATILEELPRGSTSRCYRAKTVDDESVVVRVFDPFCSGAPLQLPAFQRGVRALNRLQATGEEDLLVVELVAVALDETAYVVREYPGKSLKELLDISLTLQAGLEAIVSLAKTMVVVHRQGVMVRSWKPSNVLVDGYNLLVSEPDMVHLVTLAQHQGNGGGYLAYAAPEEILGRGTRSPTADVFSLGKMLEFLLTGEEPLVPLGSPPLISQRDSVPRVLVEIVRRATLQDPIDRYQRVEDFLADVVSFQEEGDHAVLRAPLRPGAPSRLSAHPLSSGRKQRAEAKFAEREHDGEEEQDDPAQEITWHRQVEVAIALLGGVVGFAVLVSLILLPPSQIRLDMLALPLAALLALSVFALPKPSSGYWIYRLLTLLGAASMFSLINPLALAAKTWSHDLATGSLIEKQNAVLNLARGGKFNFRRKNLDDISLMGADLGSANFTASSLRSANFSGTFLVEARFDGADLTDAIFHGAQLVGAHLLGAKGLEKARCDSQTIFPDELVCKDGLIFRLPPSVRPESGEEPGAP